MDKRQLKQLLKRGGATINTSGESVNFASGFQVSVKDCYVESVEKVNAITRDVNKLLAQCKKGDFVGLWVNDGKVYIDLSIRIRKQNKAERIGRSLQQLAIYDWATGECISL